MKVNHIILLLIFPVLTACPPSMGKQNAKKLRDNKMNFPDLYDQTFEGITFDLSEMFESYYSDNFVISELYSTHYIPDMDIYFSVEKFTEQDIRQLEYIFEHERNKTKVVHDFYVDKREKSLFQFISSTEKDLSSYTGKPTLLQVIHTDKQLEETVYNFDSDQSYFTASMQVDEEIFVFQLIGKKDNMRYLYDDFLRMLKSVR